MSQHSTKSDPRQDLSIAHSAYVELPLPMLSAIEDIEYAFFGICVEAGKQGLGAMIEHDRTALCGLPWKPDEERPGRRAGSTESPVTLGERRIAMVDLAFGRSTAPTLLKESSTLRHVGFASTSATKRHLAPL